MARDHGGNLDEAMARFGGTQADWLDLSTGINPEPYPVPALSAQAWSTLPTRSETASLEAAAQRAYGSQTPCVALAGAQAAIQLVPRLARPGKARVLGPTYNEHAASLSAQGWHVETVTAPDQLRGADLAVVVNPNNPDGQHYSAQTLLALAAHTGLLVVDESFADPEPGYSLASDLHAHERIILLRSFGKFYGLAGLRLGFALTAPQLAAKLRALAGPWAASGPAIEIGRAALMDVAWQEATRMDLRAGAARLDGLAEQMGWRLVGGTPLFRTYETPEAAAAQAHLARAHIWSRIFPYSPSWLRLGLPPQARWTQLTGAMTACP